MRAVGRLARRWAAFGHTTTAYAPAQGAHLGLRCGLSAVSGGDGRRGMAKYRQYPFEIPANEITSQGKAVTTNVFVTHNVGSKFIMLNRPEANNALTLDMVREIREAYDQAYHEQWTRVVVLFGAGENSFCSGGDVRALWEAGMYTKASGQPRPPQMEFFQAEYDLNNAIRIIHEEVDTVAIMTGYTMGGGCGLANHADFRLVTDNVQWAMPECALGIIPDVGSSGFLSVLPGTLGRYLALTGQRLNSKEMILTGLGTHYIEWGQIPWLLERIESTDEFFSARQVRDIVETYTEDVMEPEPMSDRLQAQQDQVVVHFVAIERCFKHNSVAEIRSAVAEEKARGGRHAAWADRTLQQLEAASPTSLAVALELLRRVEAKMEKDGAQIAECLELEFTAMRRVMENPDFFEGVRAFMVDKDRAPKWAPEPTAEQVAAYFEPLPAEEALVLSRMNAWRPIDGDIELKRALAQKREEDEESVRVQEEVVAQVSRGMRS